MKQRTASDLALDRITPAAAAARPTSVEILTFRCGPNRARAILERTGNVWHLRFKWRRRTLVVDLVYAREHELERALREAAHYFEVPISELDEILCKGCRFGLDAEHLGYRV